MSLGAKFSSLYQSSICIGLEIRTADGQSPTLHAVSLRKKADSIALEKSFGSIANMEELFQTVGKQHPFVLVFTGKGIVQRKLPQGQSTEKQHLLNTVFPNASPDEFYLQSCILADQSIYISVIRKKIIDDALDFLKKEGIHVVDVLIGPSGLLNLLPFLDSEGTENISLGHYTIIQKEARPMDIVANVSMDFVHRVAIGNDPVEQESLLAYSSALHYFIEDENIVYKDDITGESREEFKQKKKFEVLGAGLLTLTFLLLLINFLVFDYFSKEYQKLEEQSVEVNAQSLLLKELQDRLATKTKVVKEIGLSEKSLNAYYADLIASTVSDEIVLKQLNINPAKKGKKNGEEELLFITNSITVSGLVSKSPELNSWVKELKSFDWISEIVILNYAQPEANNPGEFTIEITIKQ